MEQNRNVILGFGMLLLIACSSVGVNANDSFLMSFWATETSITSPPTLEDFQDCATLDVVDEAIGNRATRIYVKNTADYLWLAFRLKWTYSASIVANSKATLSIDGDHDSYWAEDCKILEGTTLTDGYYLRSNPNVFPDVSTTPDFEASWTEVDARAEQGAADEQLLYFKIPLTSEEYLYDLNVPDINNQLIGIGLLIETGAETLRFFGQTTELGNSVGFLTVSLASAGDEPAPDYEVGGEPSNTSTYPDIYPYKTAAATPGFGLVMLGFCLTILVVWRYYRSRRKL
ncbi:MAG: hypothetical protein ACFFCZ_13355 [Promethearchaeota archaeon]